MTDRESVVIGHRDALTLRRGASGPSGDLWSLDVRLVGEGLVAEANVEPEGAERSLTEFFDDLAGSWRGWSGERQWVGLDGALSLSCTHDGLGHVRIEVSLRRVSRGDWEAQSNAVVDAGQLDQIVRQLRELIGVDSG